ncbi:MAG: glycosyltransferase family 4 protein [Proteobacteria bacterium]|nr:glycosyltransferase family 4 protein [Pseudomonadota bacterium]
MRRIAFLDLIPWDYRVDTPERRPLGGSQSAMCYLAAALARRGHEVLFVTRTKEPGIVAGVECISADSVGFECFRGADLVVLLNSSDPEPAISIRAVAPGVPLLALWTQHDPDNPSLAALASVELRTLWDAVILCSDWQRRNYQRAFPPIASHLHVLRNAIAPAFARLFDDPPSILARKRRPARLCYTSTPYRGLSVLLDSFRQIRTEISGARLAVYSSMGVYQVANDDDPFRELYDRCRQQDGVDYMGSIPQPALADALKTALVFAYPCTFPETFCISALEAMAAGCLLVVGDLGALRETTAPFAELVEIPTDQPDYAARFAMRVTEILRLVDRDPVAVEFRLAEQVRHVNRTATWDVRAAEWSDWLETALARKSSGATYA